MPTDVSFFVSGSTGHTTGISLFGGDLFTSGNMHVGTVSSDSGGTALYMKDDKVIFNSSDIRLKANLRNIEDPLDKVMALKGYRYNAIGDLSRTTIISDFWDKKLRRWYLSWHLLPPVVTWV